MSFDTRKNTGEQTSFTDRGFGKDTPPQKGGNQNQSNQPPKKESTPKTNWLDNAILGVFDHSTKEMVSSPKVIMHFILFFAWFAVAVMFTKEDIYTTMEGFKKLPIKQALEYTPLGVGILLWVMPSVSTIIFAKTKQIGWLKIGIACLFIDSVFDTMYRMQTPWAVDHKQFILEFVTSLILSLSVFTVGSELGISIGGGYVIELAPYALYHLMNSFKKFFSLVGLEADFLEKGTGWLENNFMDDSPKEKYK